MAELGENWKSGVIYKYTSPSGKHYIGQTTDPLKRKSKHKNESVNLKTKFATAIRKYGYENFKYEILLNIKNTNDLVKLKTKLDIFEIAFISFYNSVNKGYNLALGGGGSLGYKHTEKWKLEKSKSMIGNTNSIGIKKSDEDRKIISQNLTGRPVSENTRLIMKEKKEKSIYQFNKNGEFIAEFKSAGDAALLLNLNRRAISACCAGSSKSSGGFIWKHKNN